MIRKSKKDSINWLANQQDARALIPAIGARNLTIVEAVVIHIGITDKEEVIGKFDKMVMFDGKEADYEVLKWMDTFPVHHPDHDGKYVYFRIKK